jgi:hypothetical protein
VIMRSEKNLRLKVGFIGIGAQKAATSWLHDVLSAHPHVEASRPKELDFFTHHFDRGYAWYESHFRRSEDGVMRGESSPSYLYSQSAPRRARDYNRNLKLVAILRDPVSRAFSNHLHEIRKGHIPGSWSFEEALELNPMYLEQGRYALHLGRWLEVFDRQSLLVLVAEDIATDPETAFSRVCEHLGVSPKVKLDKLGERSHESVANRNEGVQKVLRTAGNAARSLGLGKAVRGLKATPGLRDLIALNRRDLRSEFPAMRPETVERLRAFFEPDIAFVSELLERKCLPWPSHRSRAETRDQRATDTIGMVHVE